MIVINKHQRVIQTLCGNGYSIGNFSRNFSVSAAIQSNESSIFGDDTTKITETKNKELYNKQMQYRKILTRVNGSKIYNRHSETLKIEQCKNIDELKALYQEMHRDHDMNLIPKFDYYNAFLRKAMDIDPDFHQQLIDELKQKFLAKDCEYDKKEVSIGKLFNSEMTAAMQLAENTKQGIDKMFEIWEEMVKICNNDENSWSSDLPYYPLTLNRLISACIITGQYSKCQTIIDNILWNDNKWNTFNYNKTQQIKLWNSILNYYAKIKDIDKMEKVYNKMTREYRKKPDDVTMNIRINAFAKDGDERFETTFTDYVKTFNKYPTETVFAALLNGYSFKGDIVSCITVLKLLLSKTDKNNQDPMRHSLPNPDFTIFVPIFKAFTMNNKELIDADHGWELIDYLYNEMIHCGVSPVEIVYGIIFSLCGDSFFDKPSLEKLKFYYNEMTVKYNLHPQHTQLKNVLKAGCQYFEHDNNNVDQKEKWQFVKWWKQEMDKFNVTINNEMRHILINAGCIQFLG